MNTINSLVIEGNMVKEPVIRETSRANKVCNFSIAVNRSIKNASGEFSKEVSFFDVECWGSLAEACEREGAKGRGVRIVGRLKQNRWEGQDGKRYSRVCLVAEHIEYKAVHEKKAEVEENFVETEVAEEVAF